MPWPRYHPVRCWWYKWRLRVWKRRLAFRLLDLEAQNTHPTGGEKYTDTKQGRIAHTDDLENLVTRARHQIMILTARLNPQALEGIAEYPKMRALKTGERSPEKD